MEDCTWYRLWHIQCTILLAWKFHSALRNKNVKGKLASWVFFPRKKKINGKRSFCQKQHSKQSRQANAKSRIDIFYPDRRINTHSFATPKESYLSQRNAKVNAILTNNMIQTRTVFARQKARATWSRMNNVHETGRKLLNRKPFKQLPFRSSGAKLTVITGLICSGLFCLPSSKSQKRKISVCVSSVLGRISQKDKRNVSHTFQQQGFTTSNTSKGHVKSDLYFFVSFCFLNRISRQEGNKCKRNRVNTWTLIAKKEEKNIAQYTAVQTFWHKCSLVTIGVVLSQSRFFNPSGAKFLPCSRQPQCRQCDEI